MKKRGISLLSIIIFIIIVIAVVVCIKAFKPKIQIPVLNESSKGEKSKFSLEMLENNGLGENITINDLKNKFGTLNKSNSYVKISTGENIDEYTGSGVTVIFRNNKFSICIVTNNQDFEFNGIKLGDSEDKLVNAFYKESTNNDVITKDGKNIGKYLYGTFTVDNLEEEKTSDKIEYACKTNDGDSQSNLYDYIIEYVYMEPPYKSEYATKNDDAACLEFGIKDGNVSTFACQIGPLEN